MWANQEQITQLYVGIDGGGSKCRASIYTQEFEVLGTGVAGRANPLHGLEQTFESITQSVLLALKDAGLPESTMSDLIAGMGLAGVNVPRLHKKMMDWAHPFKAIYLTTDLHTACLGAHKSGDGALIITGTGSCGFAQVNDETLCLGGHGFALGDKGSGAWIGLKAAEHVLLNLDGFACDTALTPAILAQCEAKDAVDIVEKLAGKSSSCYAAMARAVIACANEGDEVANNILQEGAKYISELARKLFTINPKRFSMVGGLAEPMRKWLDDDVVERISPILAPPEAGAMYFALQQNNKNLQVAANITAV